VKGHLRLSEGCRRTTRKDIKAADRMMGEIELAKAPKQATSATVEAISKKAIRISPSILFASRPVHRWLRTRETAPPDPHEHDERQVIQ